MKKVIVFVVVFLAAFGITLAILKNKEDKPAVDPEIRQHAENYVKELGSKPFDTLSDDDKLYLLNSYHDLGEDAETIRLAEQMIPLLQSLPPKRQKPFLKMVMEAYRDLGRDEEATEFEDKITGGSDEPAVTE